MKYRVWGKMGNFPNVAPRRQDLVHFQNFSIQLSTSLFEYRKAPFNHSAFLNAEMLKYMICW